MNKGYPTVSTPGWESGGRSDLAAFALAIFLSTHNLLTLVIFVVWGCLFAFCSMKHNYGRIGAHSTGVYLMSTQDFLDDAPPQAATAHTAMIRVVNMKRRMPRSIGVLRSNRKPR